MSDLEDDVLMQLINASRTLDQMKQRDRLLTEVWKDLDVLLKVLIRMPGVTPLIQTELSHLHRSVAAVVTYEAEHRDEHSFQEGT